MALRTLPLRSLLPALVCSLVFAASASSVVGSAVGVWHDRETGLRISYPAGWHVTTRSLTMITQPAERFVVYSGSLPGSLDQFAPGANQALALVMEQTSLSASDLKQFPRRPTRFTVSRLGGMETFYGRRWAERVFQDHGRAFYAFIWVGAHDKRQLPTLLAVLDSLRVT